MRSKHSRSPPIMKVSSPFSAPCLLPVTGASSILAPLPARWQANLRLTVGLMVLESISTAPSRMPSMMPPLPSTTSSIAAVSLTMVQIIPASRAASAGLPATRAPACARAFVFPGVRLKTVTLYPAFTRFSAMGWPIIPRPIKAIDSGISVLLLRHCPLSLALCHLSPVVHLLPRMAVSWAGSSKILNNGPTTADKGLMTKDK